MQSCASMWTQQSKAGWGRCHTQYTGPCWKCPYTPMSTRKENIVAAVFVVSDPPPGDKQRQTESDMFTRTASTRRWKLFAFPCVSFWEEAHWLQHFENLGDFLHSLFLFIRQVRKVKMKWASWSMLDFLSNPPQTHRQITQNISIYFERRFAA